VADVRDIPTHLGVDSAILARQVHSNKSLFFVLIKIGIMTIKFLNREKFFSHEHTYIQVIYLLVSLTRKAYFISINC
jgi:hypothetical protein